MAEVFRPWTVEELELILPWAAHSRGCPSAEIVAALAARGSVRTVQGVKSALHRLRHGRRSAETERKSRAKDPPRDTLPPGGARCRSCRCVISRQVEGGLCYVCRPHVPGRKPPKSGHGTVRIEPEPDELTGLAAKAAREEPLFPRRRVDRPGF